MDTNIIQSDYQGILVAFTEKAWFNATTAATRFGKEAHEWLRLDSTKEYIAVLSEESQSGEIPELKTFVKTKRGRYDSGTWMHPDLAVAFARWLDVRFSIWCDRQIKNILTGSHPHFDWRAARIEAASGYSVMSEILQETRADEGKETQFFHYANEAKMINEILFGTRESVNRSALCKEDLRLLSKIEARNAAMIGRHSPYPFRKGFLSHLVAQERAKTTAKLSQ